MIIPLVILGVCYALVIWAILSLSASKAKREANQEAPSRNVVTQLSQHNSGEQSSCSICRKFPWWKLDEPSMAQLAKKHFEEPLAVYHSIGPTPFGWF